jgi:hypothetical protein
MYTVYKGQHEAHTSQRASRAASNPSMEETEVAKPKPMDG